MRLGDLAAFGRSKTAGPFMVTFDIMFHNEEDLYRAWESESLTKERIAQLYPGVAVDDVMMFIIPAALAIKISFPRRVVSGALGDTDIAASQQFAPLFELPIGDRT
ncbi:DUF4387 domain-containing protein [Rhodococcus rhodochrous]|uniref:DUF4387 domain-containing protein n=1 Tax=Rhodococcus rhodochrous KG-21 TaxID=1441923 RepID=A0A0M8PJ37_RHORH|nr:DUF4387 domain-containing protein [Rhodococcus rhodochrous]KOS57594.1 hypothetical protein Z051_03725 [Rhodococcus rhodochrous KG-21]